MTKITSDTDKDVKDVQKLGNYIHSLPDEVLEKMQADGVLFLPEIKDEEVQDA